MAWTKTTNGSTTGANLGFEAKLWGIAGENLCFSAVGPSSLLTHIPVNQGAGQWEVLSIRFADTAIESTVATRVQDILVTEDI